MFNIDASLIVFEINQHFSVAAQRWCSISIRPLLYQPSGNQIVVKFDIDKEKNSETSYGAQNPDLEPPIPPMKP